MIICNMKKSYKKVEKKEQVAKEPIAEYGPSKGMERQSASNKKEGYLPSEILVNAAKYTTVAREQGRMVSNDDVYDVLAHKLGWK